jgi:predicted AlkP superfamily pyrophosphatase or phosphodiesterase
MVFVNFFMSMSNPVLRLCTGVMLLVALSLSSFGQSTSPKNKPTGPSQLPNPKLVVGIVVDQMRYDYIYRYYNKYVEGGFKRFLNEGFNARNHHYHYALTVTGAGHSAIYTGSLPAINGVVANEWYDKIQGRNVYCSEDASVATVGSSTASVGKMSPKNLLTSTVTDQLRIATNFTNKTIGIALKDRGSILPAGHTANAAYWFDSRTGNWVTSTYYMKELPQWVQDYNAKRKPTEYLQKGWNTLLPIEQYTESTADDQPYERAPSSTMKPVFPYDLGGISGDPFGIVAGTPWGNTITLEMAQGALLAENLGRGSSTDFLAISLSTPDYVGHAFGPNSIEEQDIYLRLDRELATFFQLLDARVGKGQYTVFMTADHGVMDVPGFWKQHNLPAGLLNSSQMSTKVKESLNAAFGEGDYILANNNYQLYLNYATLDAKKISMQQVYEVVRKALLPMDGIADVINLADLGNSHLNSYLLELYRNGTHAKRSGDIQIVAEPGWFAGGSTGTTHGSPYNYDTHVPFLLYGWGVKKGETLRRTTIADIAPTISALLKILPPSGNVGNPVHEALK